MFIGPKETIGVSKIEDSEMVKVLYKDGSSEEMTKLMYDNIVKEEATDLTIERANRVYPIVEEILKVLLKWGVKISEIDYLTTMVITSINQNMGKAEEILWGKEQRQINLIDADRVLKRKDS